MWTDRIDVNQEDWASRASRTKLSMTFTPLSRPSGYILYPRTEEHRRCTLECQAQLDPRRASVRVALPKQLPLHALWCALLQRRLKLQCWLSGQLRPRRCMPRTFNHLLTASLLRKIRSLHDDIHDIANVDCPIIDRTLVAPVHGNNLCGDHRILGQAEFANLGFCHVACILKVVAYQLLAAKRTSDQLLKLRRAADVHRYAVGAQ
mmetsp:Transcript_34454/g.94837  ORF Transcript_34454/g.94837 Transcript_34454/m.94837 type:complete len:206 (-) Transcript_34454:340-957(-)